MGHARWCALLGIVVLPGLVGGCRSVESRLETPVTVRFDNVALANALPELSRQCGVPIELHESAAASGTKRISLRLDRVPCRDALAWVLRIVGPDHSKSYLDRYSAAESGRLVWIVEGDRVLVMSGEAFLRRQPKVVRYYDLADLGASREEANQIVELITAIFAPGTWEDMNAANPAWIRLRSGKLVVCHHERIQGRIKGLLDSLRRSAQDKPDTPEE
jgi:hypothetical protein